MPTGLHDKLKKNLDIITRERETNNSLQSQIHSMRTISLTKILTI